MKFLQLGTKKRSFQVVGGRGCSQECIHGQQWSEMGSRLFLDHTEAVNSRSHNNVARSREKCMRILVTAGTEDLRYSIEKAAQIKNVH
jgi:hypothetical protein